MTSKKVRDAFLALLPEDGSAIGNGLLRKQMAERLKEEVEEETYAQLRDELVEAGLVQKGAGRGGTVRRADRPAELVLESQEAGSAPKKRAPRQAAAPAPRSAAATTEEAQALGFSHGYRSTQTNGENVSPKMTPDEFVQKWAGAQRTEKQAAQEHFIDLCRMVGVQTPNEGDANDYTFEKHLGKNLGGKGFADVWKRGRFGWEYKGPRKDLTAAYKQLLDYREALENPPLLVVSDLDRIEVHTNFTGTHKVVHSFTLAELKASPEQPLRVLRSVFLDPRELRPSGPTREQLTEAAASDFAELAGRLQKRGNDPLKVAHFLNRLLFCLFAEDVAILPRGLLTRLIITYGKDPKTFATLLKELFGKMAKGGNFGADKIEWFNGGLFDDDSVLLLDSDDLKTLKASAELDWSNIEPAILGTLFERGLDPDARGQLGAHYTDPQSILRVVNPVVLMPLRREFDAMKARITELLASSGTAETRKKSRTKAVKGFKEFLGRLRNVTVLDPACGSGNFLYITLRLLHDLEREVILWGAETFKGNLEFPQVGPQAVKGIELNPYAAELARVTIWIGELQWMISHGYAYSNEPILKKLETVERRDAVLDLSDPENPARPEWPKAEFVVGNPPFIGGKKLRTHLGDVYVDALFAAWRDLVPREADFVCYWHERLRELIEQKKVTRGGLLATQGIRGGANRRVLERIKETGDIFMAWSDEEWVVEGASVNVSIVGQDDGSERQKFLDGKSVEAIHADLSAGGRTVSDLTQAVALSENRGVSFMGDTKGGKFEVEHRDAAAMLKAPTNVNGRPNSDVIVPWVNGLDVTRRPRGLYIIDFGLDLDEQAAAQYERPFEHVLHAVKATRANNKREAYAAKWWRHVEPRPQMRAALASLPRFIGTARVAKHRLFVWMSRPTLPDSQIIVIARADDYGFGVLHSRAHEVWALKKGTQLEDRPRYTPTSTFETFPFPWPLNTPEAKLTPQQREHEEAIAKAARELNSAREAWLNPPELVRQESALAPGFPALLVPRDDDASKELAGRTLTKLYNKRPEWLRLAHRRLDEAVFAAYGWPRDLSDQQIASELLKLNYERAGTRVARKIA